MATRNLTTPSDPLICYDGGGAALDRYAVYFLDRVNSRNGLTAYLAMSGNPFHPLGFGQHGEGEPGAHNGKVIAFTDLPPACQALVWQDCGPSEVETAEGA